MHLTIVEMDDSFIQVMQTLKEEKKVPTGVTLIHGAAFDSPADALVSPANSMGIMRGGFDGFIARKIPGIEARVQQAIRDKTGRDFLPVGKTITIPVMSPTFRNLIVAPTMPRPGSRTSYAAISKVADSIFRENPRLLSITMTPLGTGVGGLDLQKSVEVILESYKKYA